MISHCDLELLARNFSRHNIGFLKFNDREEVLAYLQSNLNQTMQIAWGGSVTLNECGILHYLRREKFPRLCDRDNPELSEEERMEIERKAFSADVFLTSANAITEDGLIVNIDGAGNRVAATIFGPKKVYFIVGINKLVKNRDYRPDRTHVLLVNEVLGF